MSRAPGAHTAAGVQRPPPGGTGLCCQCRPLSRGPAHHARQPLAPQLPPENLSPTARRTRVRTTSAPGRCSEGAPGFGSALPLAAGPCWSAGDRSTSGALPRAENQGRLSLTLGGEPAGRPRSRRQTVGAGGRRAPVSDTRRTSLSVTGRRARLRGAPQPTLWPALLGLNRDECQCAFGTCTFAAKSISTRRQARVSTMRASTRNGVHSSLSTYSVNTAPDWLRWIPAKHCRVFFSVVGWRRRGGEVSGWDATPCA